MFTVKMYSCQNNFEKSYTEKELSIRLTSFSFDPTKRKLDCYRGKDCIKIFCKNVEVHTTNIINFEEKEMIPVTDKENKSYEKPKVCYIC